ncbi:MAG: glycosyltransferase [Planctomycetes bacterium]|nr:glycosyltransferase [Planctomycetota bacterium]
MKILFASSYSHPASGVGALYNLIKGLKEKGNDCYFVSSNTHYLNIPSFDPNSSGKSNSIINRCIQKFSEKFVPCFYSRNSKYFLKTVEQINPDVINIHWTHGRFFIPFNILSELGKRLSVAMTLHDMWALTGGCFYSYECDKYLTGCKVCPQRKTLGTLHGSSMISWYLKKRLYGNIKKLTFVTASKWLTALTKKSPLTKHIDTFTIPYAVDMNIMCPMDKTLARNLLGLPPDSKVIFTFAKGNKRKGEDLFEKALLRYHQSISLTPKNLSLLIVGDNSFSWNLRKLPEGIKVFPLGTVQSRRMLALCYNAADVFVLPTRADNYPYSVLESLACGTPVLSSKVGGVPEQIEENKTGLTVAPESSTDLADGINRIMQ